MIVSLSRPAPSEEGGWRSLGGEVQLSGAVLRLLQLPLNLLLPLLLSKFLRLSVLLLLLLPSLFSGLFFNCRCCRPMGRQDHAKIDKVQLERN